jgi:O-methyltransferase domain
LGRRTIGPDPQQLPANNPERGKLLIIEAVVPTGNEPSLAKDFDMVMLGLPGGIERTAEEYEILLKQAGFRLSRIMPTTSVISIVEVNRHR